MTSPLRLLASALLLIAALTVSTQAAGIISFSPAFTDDASTGINPVNNTYTHAVGGGQAVAVNGLNFALLNPANTPANFNWNTNGTTKSAITNNNGSWVPATGGVTGAGIINLLDDFTYSSNGASTPSSQTYTLSGLTPGETYDTRLYMRTWGGTGGVRNIDFTFTNGGDVDLLGDFLEDRPDLEGFADVNNAFFLSYLFTAEGTTLVIDAAVDGTDTGSYHFYGLTNQLVPQQVPEPASLAIWGLLGIAALAVGWRWQRKPIGR